MKYLLLATLALFGCGRSGQVNPQPPPVTHSGAKLTVLAFGAPWCSTCKDILPELNTKINALPKAAQVGRQLLVTSADTPAKPPTAEIAAAYGAQYAPQMEAKTDPWRWQTFRKYVGMDFKLPAVVVLKENGDVLRVYKAGSFVVDEIIGLLNENLP